jgi:hypothetical protein
MLKTSGTVALTVFAVAAQTLSAQQECESLRSLELPHSTITSAVSVPEGPVWGGPGGGIVAPARCAVLGGAGIAPDRIIGTGRVSGAPSRPLARPLCPYPQVARYKGSGDINDAARFSCAVRPR